MPALCKRAGAVRSCKAKTGLSDCAVAQYAYPQNSAKNRRFPAVFLLTGENVALKCIAFGRMKRPFATWVRGVYRMNKQDLVSAVADSAGLTKADAGRAVDAVFDVITASLKKNQEVRLVGFGTFLVTKRAASKGRNPRTGETIKIKASKSPKFRAGKALKDAIN